MSTPLGAGYMGSKNKIALQLIDKLPPADVFVDAFGGGGAMTCAAAISGKYKKIIYNELNKMVYEGVKKALTVGYHFNELKWVSREEFLTLKDVDFGVASCFSFGSKLDTYAWCDENEEETRKNFEKVMSRPLLHLANTRCEPVVRFRRLVNLAKTPNKERIEFHNTSYEKLEIPTGAVIYCDPPYRGTADYKGVDPFDFDKFDNWLRAHKNVFISEYSMPKDFICIWKTTKTCTMAQTVANKTIEKLFIPSLNLADYQPCGQLSMFEMAKAV